MACTPHDLGFFVHQIVMNMTGFCKLKPPCLKRLNLSMSSRPRRTTSCTDLIVSTVPRTCLSMADDALMLSSSLYCIWGCLQPRQSTCVRFGSHTLLVRFKYILVDSAYFDGDHVLSAINKMFKIGRASCRERVYVLV